MRRSRCHFFVAAVPVFKLLLFSISPTVSTTQAAESWNSSEILQLCSKWDGANKKYGDYKKTDDKYLYLESAFGLDWLMLRNDSNSVKAVLRVRDWRSGDGKYKVRASLQTLDIQSIKLQREDSGKVITVPVDRLDSTAKTVLTNVQNRVRKIRDALNVIELQKRTQTITAEQLTDEELTLLVNSQGKILPANIVRLLNDMLTDPDVVSAAHEKAGYPEDITQSRLVLLLKATAAATLLKVRFAGVGGLSAEEIGGVEWDKRFKQAPDDQIVFALANDLVKEPAKLNGRWGDAWRREAKKWAAVVEEVQSSVNEGS